MEPHIEEELTTNNLNAGASLGAAMCGYVGYVKAV
jgi:hypothetical protein